MSKVNRKLSLDLETLRHLDGWELSQVAGGFGVRPYGTRGPGWAAKKPGPERTHYHSAELDPTVTEPKTTPLWQRLLS